MCVVDAAFEQLSHGTTAQRISHGTTAQPTAAQPISQDAAVQPISHDTALQPASDMRSVHDHMSLSTSCTDDGEKHKDVVGYGAERHKDVVGYGAERHKLTSHKSAVPSYLAVYEEMLTVADESSNPRPQHLQATESHPVDDSCRTHGAQPSRTTVESGTHAFDLFLFGSAHATPNSDSCRRVDSRPHFSHRARNSSRQTPQPRSGPDDELDVALCNDLLLSSTWTDLSSVSQLNQPISPSGSSASGWFDSRVEHALGSTSMLSFMDWKKPSGSDL